MLDLQTRIAQLNRPALLARAARFGVDDYRREVHLRRIVQTEGLPRPAAALMQLLALEDDTDALRRDRSANYRAAKHVEILIAIMGEVRLMRQGTHQGAQPAG